MRMQEQQKCHLLLRWSKAQAETEKCCYATGTSAQGHISLCVCTSMRGFANKAVLNMINSDVLLCNCLIDSCLGIFTTYKSLSAAAVTLQYHTWFFISCKRPFLCPISAELREEVEVVPQRPTLHLFGEVFLVENSWLKDNTRIHNITGSQINITTKSNI